MEAQKGKKNQFDSQTPTMAYHFREKSEAWKKILLSITGEIVWAIRARTAAPEHIGAKKHTDLQGERAHVVPERDGRPAAAAARDGRHDAGLGDGPPVRHADRVNASSGR